MRAEDKLQPLRDAAEKEGTVEAWRAYAAEMERLMTPLTATYVADPEDPELSEQTPDMYAEVSAHLRVRGKETDVWTAPVQLVSVGGLLYVLEARAQPSGPAHGMQGLRPQRGALLETLSGMGVPILVAFKDGKLWKSSWWKELPAAKAISLGDDDDRAATQRFGWDAGKHGPLRRTEELPLPEDYNPKPPAQPRLGED